jgi:long-chain fatty acid transport protein
MTRKNLICLLATSTLALPTTAHANGYYLQEVSAPSVGQAGATMAQASDPSTVFSNPAGMTRLEGFQVQANLLLYGALSTSFQGPAPNAPKENMDAQVFPIPTLFLNWKVNEWLAVGFGSYMAYGLGVKWPERWSGYSLIRDARIESYQLQPSIAIGPFKGVSLGVGLDVLIGSVDMTRGLQLADGNWGKFRLGGSSSAVGFNAGLLYEPIRDVLRVGATFRSAMKLSLDSGKGQFDVPPALQETLRNQTVQTSLTTPWSVGIGARYFPTPKLGLEVDGQLVGWSTFNELRFTFADPALNQVQKKDFFNAVQLRVGGEYKVDRTSVRTGFLFDGNPIPDETLDPLLPDSYRFGFAGGFGYAFFEKLDKLRADLGYMFVYVPPRTVAAPNPFPGTYRSNVHVLNIGLSARF